MENIKGIKAKCALIANIPLQPEGFRNSLTPVCKFKTFMHLKIFIFHSNMPQKDFLPSKILILILLYKQETADKAE